MKRKFTLLIAALALLTMMASTGTALGQSDYSSDYTGNITLSTAGGTNASDCVIAISGTNYAGIKAGTSSKVGAVVVTVPSGTKYLHIHAAAWNGTTASLAVTPDGYSENIALTANSGITNNSPFTFNGDPSTSDYYKVITFSDALTANTNLTFTAVGGKRFVIWGVTSEEESSGDSPSITLPAYSFDVNAEGGDNEIPVTYTNMPANPQASVIFYESDGTTETTYDWVTAVINDSYNIDGHIIVNEGDARSAYFKVKGIDANNNEVYSNLVTINQAAGTTPPTSGWVLTNLADLTVDDIFVIVGDNGDTYALPNNNGTSSAPAAVAVTVSNGALSAEPADNIKWNLSGNATDGYTFYPNGNNETWLYCTNTNNGVRVGTNNNKAFTVDHDYLYNTATSRHIGIYNSQDWRCYSPQESGEVHNNIAGQTFAFYKKVEDPSTPSITAADVNIAYDATEGVIGYTINNPVAGASFDAVPTHGGDRFDIGTIGANTISFSCPVNTEATEQTATIELRYTYNRTTITKEVTITQAAAPVVYSTIPALFAAATSTETNVLVTFNNWVVSGVSTNGKSIFVTDNNGNGFVIYYTSDMSNTFAAGNVLSGTAVSCTLKLYNGFAELLNVDANDLTITTGGTVTVANVTMADLTGVNTGALVHYENLTCSVDNNKYYLSDGTTTIQVYNAIFAFEALEADNTYNITGVYQQFNSTKEVLPRSADDIVEVTIPVLTTENVDIACDATEGVITYTVTNPASDGNLTAEITAGNEGNWLTLGTIGANVPFTCTANMGAERTATVTLTYTYNTTETVTATAVVTQAAYVAPTASIVVTPTEVNATAAETEGTIIVTYENITTVVAEVYFCDAQGAATTYEWVDAEIDDDDNVYYTIDANTGEARTAYLKVHAFDDDANDVYSDLVTINQAAYVVDYATLPFAYDGNGLGTLPNGLTQEGLTDKYNNSPKMKFDGTGDWLLLHINERPGTLTFDIKGNSFSGGTFTIQTSVDGVTYTDLQAYTELGDTQSVEFGNLAEDVRYIKWIYTNKSSGNVGLGNIALAQYVEPQPSITINPGPYNLNSEGGDAVLPVTYTNMPTNPQAEVIFYESNGETALTENPTWITATINGDGNVAGHIDANTGDARSAYFKVKGIDADINPVYSDLVTINQAAYTLSIVFETTSLDIEAGGEQGRVISFEYEGLGENPTFVVRTYDASGETQTTYDWLETSITDVHKVSINVAANTGDARSAYFKVYGENGTVNTESNLVTINQAAAGQTVQYTLITSVDDLTPGYHYLIASVASEGDLNIMDVQNSNNRGVRSATVDEYNTITFTPNDAYYDFVISGDANNGWTIYDEQKPGYLYASSSSSNQLKTRDANSDGNSVWNIEFDNGNLSIVAQGGNTRNTMQYNSNNSLFACYASASQSDVYLYKKVGDTNPVYYSPTEIAVADPDPTSETIVVVNNEILVLTGNLDKCNNPDNLIVEDGGQLVFSGTGVQATMKKSTAHAGAKDVATDWYTIASPLAANVATNAVGNLTNGTYDLYRYNEAAVMWENAKDTEHSGGFNELTVGRGYLYWNGSGSDITFAGELRNADVAYTLKADGAGNYKGFNLIGNPFSQNITMSNITGVTLSGGYVLTQAGGWGASIDEIAPCQGFLVQVEAETDITITKPTSSGKSRANRDYLAFTVANSEYEDVAYAMFEEATGLSKINHRNADIPMVYIPQNGQNYAIATMDDNTQAFELNFKAMTTGQYTLSYKAEGKYSYLHVIDRLTGEDIDMLLDGEYSFIGSPRDNEARFIVKLSYNANIDEIEVNDNFAYQNGSDIIVNGNGELQVFDVTGRMVMNTKINGIQTVNVPATGMYIFRMVGESVQTQKIVVR